MRLLALPAALLAACAGAEVQFDDTKPGTTDSGGTTDPTDPTDPAPATEPIYLNTGEALYTWSIDGGPVYLGAFHDAETGMTLSGMTDIAIDADGALYAASYATLYRVDASDGGCTPAGTLPDTGTGLTFLPDGRLLVAGSALTAYDLVSGETQAVVSGNLYSTSGDVVAVPDGSIHWSVLWKGTDGWVQVDPTLGSANLVGAVGAGNLWGVAWADDTLYAFDAAGKAYEVNPATGAGTLVREDSLSWYGATTNPVSWE